MFFYTKNDKIYECQECHFAYDPKCASVYTPPFPNKTPFRKLPNNWACPNCGETKRAFKVSKSLNELF